MVRFMVRVRVTGLWLGLVLVLELVVWVRVSVR